MKRKLMIIGITILLVLTSVLTSYAAEIGTMLTVEPAKVKVGDTFTVTLSATCADGINGVVTTYSYDEDKLEYVSEGVVDTNNYSYGGNKEAKEIFVYCTSTDSIKEANLYSLTFRVKEGVAPGTTAKVSVSQITLDSDAATDSEHIMEGHEVSVTIIEDTQEGGEGQNPPAEDGENDACEHTYGKYTSNNNGTHSATCSKCNEKRTENCTYQDGICSVCGYTKPTTGEGNEKCDHSYGEYKDNGDGTHSEVCEVCGKKINTEKHTYEKGICTKCKVKQPKDNTTADKEIPKAGINSMLILGILAIVIIAVVMFRKNQKYRDIR